MCLIIEEKMRALNFLDYDNFLFNENKKKKNVVKHRSFSFRTVCLVNSNKKKHRI
jgi:hypothetical protein